MSLGSLSLRNKLLLFATALILLPGALFGIIAERSGRESLQQEIGHRLASEAGHSAERLSALLRAERQTLASFARQDLMREIRVQDIDKRVSIALSTLREGSPARRDYLVVDRSGNVVASSNPGLLGSLPAWAELGTRVEVGGRPLGPVASPDDGVPGLVMAMGIPDPDDPGRLLGALVGLLDWGLLSGVTERVREELAAHGIAAEVLVAQADGTILGGARTQAASEGATAAARSSRDAHLEEAPDYVVDAGSGLIVGRAALADLPEWKLLVVEPLSHALAPARELTRRLAITLGIALVAALGVATLAARRVVRPLTELTLAIRGLPASDPTHRRVPVRTDDEVGTLARTFNRMASELDRVQRDLVEAEKFAFVGELAAGVAHEVRTSLGVLRSSAQILGRSLPEGAGDQAAELAEMMRAEVDRLARIVDDLLTLDRPRPLQMEATPLSIPVRRAVEFVEPKAHEKGVKVRQAPVAFDPLVLCDAEMIQQVCVNLLVNAIEAPGSPGTVDVRLLGARDGYAGFEVQDDGSGVPEPLREKIFLPFVTARDGGAGLGLTFVKRVVHDHRGRVSLVPVSEAGSCFRIELPLAEEPA